MMMMMKMMMMMECMMALAALSIYCLFEVIVLSLILFSKQQFI